MPIVFPTNPSLGDVYDFGGIHYIYNGDGWVNKSIYGVSAGADIQFENYNGTGPVVLTSPTLYGISGNIYASNLATGLLYGGIISINAGNTARFDITAGLGQIHASGSSYTAPPQPTFQYVTWPGQTGITVTNLATSDTTWLYIDSSGNIQQRIEYYTDEQLETDIIIGQLVHPSRTYINLARTNPNVAYATDKQYEQFIRAFGPIKVSGHSISPNGANLKLNRSSGKAFSLGRNWINDSDNPSVVSDNAQTDCTFFRYYRGVTAGTFVTVPNQTAIDPTKYDDGTGVLATAPGGKYTIQRLFYYPNTPTLLGVYYGRALYTSLADAAANINLEDFTEIENTRTNAIFAGYLIVKGGATDLSNSSDALILQSGSFRSTSSGGGSVSLTLDDLTDVIITSPQNYQVLTYVDGVTGWENLSVTALPLVSSFNGKTGAIQGVSAAVAGSGISVSGATGSVTITNTGVLSFNGRTGAIQGVSSINGSTGAITNVAFTNINNNFTQSQNIVAPNASFTLDDTIVGNQIFFSSEDNMIYFYDNSNGGELFLRSSIPSDSITVYLPDFNTTLAGLAGTQTFTGSKTFSSLTNFSAGISASGGTFAGNITVNSARLGKTGSNLVFGDGCGNSITTGINNTLIGFESGDLISSGNQNTTVGYQALTDTTTAQNNTAVGFWALRNTTTGNNNTAVGTRALRSNTTGFENTAIGYYALEGNQTGFANIAIGNYVLTGATAANNNIGIGYNALFSNTTGSQNSAIGRNSLLSNTTASNNAAIGYQSLYSATSGGSNVGVGTSTMYRLTTGTNNSAIGYQALFGSASVTSQANTAVGYNSMVSNTSGSYNAAIGLGALYSLTSGQINVAVGVESLYSITNTSNNTGVGSSALRYATQGSRNTAIGDNAGSYKTASNTNLTAVGSDSVYIGYQSRASGDNASNEIVIGSQALGLGANTAVIGATAQASATIYGLFNAPGGISASGATFSGPIQSTRLARITSAPFEAKTTNWSPTNADDGKIFTVNISGKSTITCTVDGLSAGTHFKILLLSGNITFSSTSGTFFGNNAVLGMSAPSSTTLYCTSTNNYFVTDSA